MQVRYSARGIPSYQLEMWHDGLRKHRVIRGSDQDVIQRKAELQAAEWEDQWRAARERFAVRSAREDAKRALEDARAEAAKRTAEAQQELERIESILAATLDVDDRIEWSSLFDRATFAEETPRKPAPPSAPVPKPDSRKPQRSDTKYNSKLGFIAKLFPARRAQETAERDREFAADLKAWANAVAAADRAFKAEVANHAHALSAAEATHSENVAAWERRKLAFGKRQSEANAAVVGQREAYERHDAGAIADYCDLVLSRSQYPDYFPKEFDVEYREAGKVLVVDYSLPAPEALPTLKEVKFNSSRGEFVEAHRTDAVQAKLYDDVLYSIVLRTIHELFEADAIDALDVVVCNGYVTALDKSTGKDTTACILSLQASKVAFQAIDLRRVEPRACFKSLKGVGSSKLHGLSAVAPILQMRRDDGRFVSAQEVVNTLDASTNLASMDWEEFEHLIREVFEKEFSTAGGEVKVTRASRDGGVDAVAFDPDPIRGGKIVIQAKRYTNTVGVSAVRDLFGTVMNEGANKGILVTTSDYGPDAYDFARGKPLVLLSGANLLHMLEKHGHRARIDIAEAKRTLEASR